MSVIVAGAPSASLRPCGRPLAADPVSCAAGSGTHSAQRCHCEPVTDVTGVAIRSLPCCPAPRRARWLGFAKPSPRTGKGDRLRWMRSPRSGPVRPPVTHAGGDPSSLPRARGRGTACGGCGPREADPSVPQSRTLVGIPQAFPAHGEGGPLAVDEVPAKRTCSPAPGRTLVGISQAFPAHGEGGPLAVDEVPAKRTCPAPSHARCKGFACIRFPLAGDGKI